MPRVHLKRKEYMVSDFSSWLNDRMYRRKLSQKDLGQFIGISQPAFSNRMKKGLFSYEDIITLLDKLEATDEEILRLMKM